MKLGEWLRSWTRQGDVGAKDRYFESVFDDTMEELRKSGFSGVCFQPSEYAGLLARHIGMYVRMGEFHELDNPLLKVKLRELGLAGATIPDPERNTIWVVLPEGLSGLARREVALHELSHIACAHEFKPRQRMDVQADSSEEEELSPWRPPRKFSISRSVDPNLYEDEADLRAVALLHASIYGRKIADRPEYFLGLANNKFPRPLGLLESARISGVR